jgi:hypothetical protein
MQMTPDYCILYSTFLDNNKIFCLKQRYRGLHSFYGPLEEFNAPNLQTPHEENRTLHVFPSTNDFQQKSKQLFA